MFKSNSKYGSITRAKVLWTNRHNDLEVRLNRFMSVNIITKVFVELKMKQKYCFEDQDPNILVKGYVTKLHFKVSLYFVSDEQISNH